MACQVDNNFSMAMISIRVVGVVCTVLRKWYIWVMVTSRYFEIETFVSFLNLDARNVLMRKMRRPLPSSLESVLETVTLPGIFHWQSEREIRLNSFRDFFRLILSSLVTAKS